jgi:uncharacterized protein
MELSHTRIVPAPPKVVWDALNDAAVLKDCIPGCESFERVSDNEWRATVATRVGPVSARFAGKVQIVDATPPTGYTLKFEGQGGAAGFANGEARVALSLAEGEQTALTYTAKAQVGGKIAQIGSRLIDGAAQKLADDFFTRFTARVAPQAVEIATQAPAATALAPAGGVPWIRYAAIVAIVVLLIILYLRPFK